jgi:hypothetical protein
MIGWQVRDLVVCVLYILLLGDKWASGNHCGAEGCYEREESTYYLGDQMKPRQMKTAD